MTLASTKIEIDREDFALLRAYLFVLGTMNEAVPDKIKVCIEKIERELARIGNVKSHFDGSPFVASESEEKI